MNDREEPTRWSRDPDGDVPELLPGLASARASGPSPAQLARLRAAIAQAAVVQEGARAGIIKLLIGGLIASGAVLFALRTAQVEPAPPREARAAGAARVAPVERAVAAGGPAPEPEVAAPAAPQREQAPRKASKKTAAESKPAAPAASPDIAAELALLRAARGHVRSAPGRALELIAEHERAYPRGALIEEREVLAIEALLVSARVAEATERARRFSATFPRSAHARRTRALFAEHAQGAFDRD